MPQRPLTTKRPRRSNAQRTAETRHKLITATIDCLYQFGYNATTTIRVAELANVSRGAMLHQFCTRVDLLLATAEFIINDQRNARAEGLRDAGTGPARLYAAADVSWAVQSRPSTIALLEIMMASRSDPELQRGCAPFIKQLSDLRHAGAERFAQNLGVRDVEAVHDLIHLHLAALRGLAIELIFTQDRTQIESARQLLVRYERQFAEQLVRDAAALRASEDPS